MQNTKHTCQEGRTIVETLAYIMVMITVTVSFASLVARGYYKYECSAVQQQLTDLKKTIAMRYAIDGHYANVKWNDLCEDAIGPRSLMPIRECTEVDGKEKCVCASQRGQHTFDGPVNIGPSDCNGSKTFCETYFIEFDELPQDICAQLGAKSWDTMEGSDLDHMVINDTEWGWPSSPISKIEGAKTLPVYVDDAVNACHEGYDNKIVWYFN